MIENFALTIRLCRYRYTDSLLSQSSNSSPTLGNNKLSTVTRVKVKGWLRLWPSF